MAQIIEKITENLSRNSSLSPEEAGAKEMYNAVANAVKNILLGKRKQYNHNFKKQNAKRVHYLSMEFLLGRSLKNNLYNLGLEKEVSDFLSQYNLTLQDLYDQEPDAGLGNGGLGRLAACYMDALATGNYPATGHCLLYEYGIFQQKLVDGWQTELPDNWLPGGEVWLKQRTDKAVTVRFGGKVTEQWQQDKMVSVLTDCDEVEAIPYDLMLSGYQSQSVAVLRLWSAHNKQRFDMHAFSQGEYMKALQADAEAEIITKVLYPSDNNMAGKSLRLKQQYLLVSAAIQDILGDHLKRYPDLTNLADVTAIHINDTHPVLAILELMKVLLDEHGFTWEQAWEITTKTCAYTNHTVMSEALESWQEDFFQRMLPRQYDIAKEINRRASLDMWEKSQNWKKVSNTAVLSYNQVKMANLAIVGSHKINGVSALHTQILKSDLFADFYSYYPEKFENITNGIACRRWLCQSNPRLTDLLCQTIGGGFIKDFSQLQNFEKFSSDAAILQKIGDIKYQNKVDFSNLLAKRGISVDPLTRFDVQVKRLHEYKRQLLNAMRIIDLYLKIKANPSANVTPQTFIFGAKAASSYYMAKEVIKLIYKLSVLINNDKQVCDKIKVVFLENYCVSTAEQLIPASEVSQQISLAGKEASGTGNMKFMINGAVTMGTLDGANVEIAQAVGKDNVIIFGNTTEQVNELWQKGYNSMNYYFADDGLRAIVDFLKKGFCGSEFSNIVNYLLKDNIPDPYMCFADFASYMNAQKRLDALYVDKEKWNKTCLINVANAGIFSADRSVAEYAGKIWGLKPFTYEE